MGSFTEVLIYMNKTMSCRLRELKNKGIVYLGSSKSGGALLRERALTERFPLQSLRHSSNVLSERWQQLVSYESVRKESFDCSDKI